MRQVLAICCFCEKVRDDKGIQTGGEVWQEFKIYMATYGLRPADVRFSHTYCPGCLASYREFLTSTQAVIPQQEME